MLWTAEAVEDLKRLALEGKSASHIATALGVGSRNAVIGKASRIGIKLSGGGARRAPGATPAPRGSAPMGGGSYPRPNTDETAPGCRCSRSEVSPAGGARRHGSLAKPRSERCDGCGSRRFANPPAGGRSAIREAESSPIAGLRRQRAILLRRPLPDGLSATAGRGRAHGSGRVPRHREFVAAVLRRRRSYARTSPLRPLEPADQARRIRARSRRIDPERMRSGRKPTSRAMVST